MSAPAKSGQFSFIMRTAIAAILGLVWVPIVSVAPASAMSRFECIGFDGDYIYNSCRVELQVWYEDEFGRVDVTWLEGGGREWHPRQPHFLNVCFAEDEGSTHEYCAA